MKTLKQRLQKLDAVELVSMLNDYEHKYSILNSCENRSEIEDCIICAIESDMLDEVILITIESGR